MFRVSNRPAGPQWLPGSPGPVASGPFVTWCVSPHQGPESAGVAAIIELAAPRVPVGRGWWHVAVYPSGRSHGALFVGPHPARPRSDSRQVAAVADGTALGAFWVPPDEPVACEATLVRWDLTPEEAASQSAAVLAPFLEATEDAVRLTVVRALGSAAVA